MNLENVILDIFDDVNLKHTLVKVASKLSDDLKNQELPDTNMRETLDDKCFALSLFTKSANKLNRFPIDTKLNTSLSNIYFNLNHHKLPYGAIKVAATNIKKACEKFQVEPTYSVKVASSNDIDTNLYFEDPLESAKKTSRRFEQKVAYDCFALNNKYPLQDKEHVKQASDYFDKYAYQFSLEDKHTFATNTYKRSKELDVPVSHNIEKYAGAVYGSASHLNQSISLRKSLLSEDSPFQKEFNKVASYREKATPEELTKVLYQLDKEAGLSKYYNGYLKDPYETICGINKTANVVYNKDNIYMTESDLKSLTKDKEKTLKNYFGETLVKGLQSDGVEAFLALPNDSKDIIARIWNGEIQ